MTYKKKYINSDSIDTIKSERTNRFLTKIFFSPNLLYRDLSNNKKENEIQVKNQELIKKIGRRDLLKYQN